MKKSVLVLVGMLVLAAMLVAGCSNSAVTPPTTAVNPPTSQGDVTTTSAGGEVTTSVAAGEVIELNVAVHFPGPSPMAKNIEAFNQEIEKRTNGRVKINFFPGGALLSPTNMVDGVSQGMADMGYMTLSYTPGRFPVSEVDTVVLGRPTAWVSTHVANDFFAQFQPKEWDEFHVLFISSNPPTGIFSQSAVRTLADLKGMKLRCQGREAEIGKLLGAETMATPSGETYDALAKGVLNGAIYPFEAAKTFRVADATKYFTKCWQALTGADFYFFMNKDSWNELPEDIQAVFTEVSAEWVEKAAVAWNDQDVAGYQYSLEMGLETIDLAPDEVDKWVQAATPITDSYIQDLVKQGFTEAEVQSWISFIRERQEYWLQEQIKAGIKSPNGPVEVQ